MQLIITIVEKPKWNVRYRKDVYLLTNECLAVLSIETAKFTDINRRNCFPTPTPVPKTTGCRAWGVVCLAALVYSLLDHDTQPDTAELHVVLGR